MASVLVDSGMVFYVGLSILFVWRQLCPWRCCGTWLQYANYCVLLYALCFISIAYTTIYFLLALVSEGGKHILANFVPWMKPLIILMPIGLWVNFFLNASQTTSHVAMIRRGEAPLKHDRAVQIIALPSVYAALVAAAHVRMFKLAVDHGEPVLMHEGHAKFSTEPIGSILYAESTEAMVYTSLSKAETCFMVGDLYEAWALYQFLKLTLELIHGAIIKQIEKAKDEKERAAARAFAIAHDAVEDLAWMGVLSFLVVCLLQSGWSLYLLFMANDTTLWLNYTSAIKQFRAAGTVASCAAIWNIHTVETKFHFHLDTYFPLLKFITVKILVSFAFFQRGIFSMLKGLEETSPGVVQQLVNKVPILGDVLGFTTVQFELFYSALLVQECLLVGIMHWWAWAATEEWYGDEDFVHPPTENDALMAREKQKDIGLDTEPATA